MGEWVGGTVAVWCPWDLRPRDQRLRAPPPLLSLSPWVGGIGCVQSGPIHVPTYLVLEELVSDEADDQAGLAHGRVPKKHQFEVAHAVVARAHTAGT